MPDNQEFRRQSPDGEEEVERDRCLGEILQEGEKVNEGNNGIICLVDIKRLAQADPRICRIFGYESAEELPEELAIKMLKIYSGKSAGKREASIQRRAFEIVNNNQQEGLAVVPRIYFSGEFKIQNDSLASLLQSEGVQLGDGGNVELLLMDYIKGDDFAVWLYKKVVDYHPGLVDLKDRIAKGEQTDVNELNDRVAIALDFRAPENPHDEYQKRRVENDNHKKMVDYLYKAGFVIDRNFIETINRTVAAFHNNGLSHNDLHERNIIVIETQGGTIRIAIVDFGSATITEGGEAASGREGNFLNDNHIIGAYSRLTHPPETRSAEIQEVFQSFREIQSLVERRYNEAYASLMESLRSIMSGEREETFEYVLAEIDNFINREMKSPAHSTSGPDRFWNIKCFILYNLATEFPQLSGQISDFIDNSRTAKNSILVQNTLSRVKTMIGNYSAPKN
jgi:hypothetical protein